jgi:predicted xylose isomerase-like sugar epimerase
MKPSYTDRLVLLFGEHPYMPFEATGLMHVAGVLAWRTRVAEARTRLRLMGKGDIKNTQTRLENGSKRSTYTFIPA